MTRPFSYNKKQKLKSRKQLSNLFGNGKSFVIFPLKVWYEYVPVQDVILKTGVGVSSRHFKKAVHRNRVKRLLREAYRLEKGPLETSLAASGKKLCVFLLFVDKTLPSHRVVQEKTKQALQRLLKMAHEADLKAP